jgi:HK97 family phage major capsid protein
VTVGVAYTVGTSADTSDVFPGDWTQLYVGVRDGLTITLLEESFMPVAGQYRFVGWWRGDIQVAGPDAFDVVTGVRA